jgi:hypothetical protein
MDNHKKERRAKKMIAIIKAVYPEFNIGEFKGILEWNDNLIATQTSTGKIKLPIELAREHVDPNRLTKLTPKVLLTFEKEPDTTASNKIKIFSGLGYDAATSINSVYSQMNSFLEQGDRSEVSRNILSTTTDGAIYTSVGQLNYKDNE